MVEPSNTVGEVFEALDKAWNAGDADGIAGVFASDCVLVGPHGAVARGRDEVRELFRVGFSAALKGSSRRTVIDSVRPVANITAAFLGSITFNFSDPSGSAELAEERGTLTGVAHATNGTWEVLQAQVTLHRQASRWT